MTCDTLLTPSLDAASSCAAPLPATVLTGDRPTGPLHLGHCVGSLRARVELQHRHQQYVLIADTQALTDNMNDPAKVHRNVLEVALDYLACGIDPQRSTIFVQSQIAELSELSMLFLNLVTVSRLERNPTIRQEIRLRGFERDIPAGFLVYPAAQAADILAFKAGLVPVGDDQLPMIEQTNELAAKFNHLVGRPFFEPCQALVSSVSRLPGIDGKAKMSKSLGNALALGASSDDIRAAVRKMYTDPGHLRVSDPGQVQGNVVFSFLDAFDPHQAEVRALKDHYRQGGLGDSVLKRRLEDLLQAQMAPIRERRQALAAEPGAVLEVLRQGTLKAREVAATTVGEVKRQLGLAYF